MIHQNDYYALKKINFISNQSQEKLLTRELDALISCDSPYIVQCYGAFYSVTNSNYIEDKQGQICIWLEYMDLGSLTSLLNKSPDKKIKEPIMMLITYKVLLQSLNDRS